MSAVLADQVVVRSRFARSVNVERDVDRLEPLNGYVVTAQALDVLARIAGTAAGESGGAWSIVGPYGSGKSSLALLIDAALGPPTPAREAAFRLIGNASREAEAAIRAVHDRYGTRDKGFCRGMVTASRESISLTLLRALRSAYERAPRRYDSRVEQLLLRAWENAEGNGLRRSESALFSILEIVRALAEGAPLLLVVDEFGKNLEAVQDGFGDPYVLQQLAEAGQGAGLPIFVVTLQHLSIEEYLAGTGGKEKREWAKIQGRFEEISFVESRGQLRALIGGVFSSRDAAFRQRIANWAASQAKAMHSMGFGEFAEPDAVELCYPLHPLTALVLPEICNRYGQNERTFFSFLTGYDPSGAVRFLAETAIPSLGMLPSIGLESIYDYFVSNGAAGLFSGRRGVRWSEIATRLRDAIGLSGQQIQMAKRIGVLNLISTLGIVRASRRLLSLTDPQAEAVLVDLEALGVVTYRDFADEYRIWQGSDIDICGIVDRAHTRIQLTPLVKVLANLDQPAPAVAARHSAENDILRVFRRRYANAEQPVQPLDPFFQYDGEILLIVESIHSTPTLAGGSDSSKPIIVAIPRDVAGLDEVARKVLAIQVSIQEPQVERDWVARRELAERLAQAQDKLEVQVHKCFRPDACRWVLLEPSGVTELPAGSGTYALSYAADIAFRHTPIVSNEVLNRSRLTSQGAKARRILLSAMLERERDSELGLKGYGPEVAMYKAFLQRTGIHKRRDGENDFSFGPPYETDSLFHAWRAIERQFERAKAERVNLRDVYAALLSTPFGMKEGVIPVLLTAALLSHDDEVAIYENGTFRPVLAPEVSERMVRNPTHFDVRHFSNTTGARRSVIDVLARRLMVRQPGRRYRVPDVVGIAGHLVNKVRRLDNFTLRTQDISPDARAVRAAIVKAVQPDELLFDILPECFGLSTVLADTTRYSDEAVYAERLGSAVDELIGRYPKLEEELLALLLRAVAERNRLAVSKQAAVLDEDVLDQKTRAFVLALRGDAARSDTDWVSTIATVLVKKAPREWADQDLVRFEHELRARVEAFHSLIALHVKSYAGKGEATNMLRVTITRTDGRVYDRLVAIDASDQLIGEGIMGDALERLRSNLGSFEMAEKAVLAYLGERLLPKTVRETPGDRQTPSV